MTCPKCVVVGSLAFVLSACGGGGTGAGGGGGGNTLFQNPVSFALGVERDPSGVAVADFNRDGGDDIAVSNFQAGTVLVALGSGGGLLSQGIEFGLDGLSAPTALAAGDFDRDGRIDLAVLAQETVATGEGPELFARVAILEGHRTAPYDAGGPAAGDFTVGAIVTIGSGYFPTAMLTADLDHDGDLDLAVATTGGDDVQVILGNGDGTFAVPAQRTIAAGFDSSAITSAHLDRDAHLDLAVTSGVDGRVAILLGVGDGTFQPPSFVSVAPGASLSCIVAVQIDRPEVFDLVVGDRTGSRLIALRGQGSGSGTPGYEVANVQALPAPPTAIVAADIDRDGLFDVAVATDGPGIGESGVLHVCLGRADATVAAPQPFQTGGVGPVALALGDLDRNGSVDVVIAHGADNTYGTLLGTSRARRASYYLSAGVVSLQSNPARNSLAIAEITRDGRPDVVVAQKFSSAIEVFLGGEGGQFSPSRSFLAPTYGGQTSAMVVGDFNGDANVDMLVGYRSSGYLGRFAGSGTDPIVNPQPSLQTFQSLGASLVTAADLAVGDVDRDGDLDLAVLDPFARRIYVARGNGDFTFTPAATLEVGPTPLEVVALGDLDDDGDLDVVGMATGGELRTFLGDGTGAFATAIASVFTSTNLGVVSELVLRDVDGDGRADAVAAASSGMYVSKGLGNGRFGAPTVAGGVGGWAAQHGVVADLDCDGALDLLPLNFGYSLPLYGDGRGSFTRDFRAYLYLQSNFQKAKFDVADLDRDGRLDFVSLNEDSLYLDIILPWNG